MEQQQPPKRTAVQRIDDLERGLMGMYQAGDNLARDIMTIKEAIKLLGGKVDAIVKATMAGEDLNDEVLSRIMVDNNVVELRNKVSQLISSGMLALSEEPINETNFVVGREVDDEGKVLNPRLQFIVRSLQENLRAKILGAKTGDAVSFQEGKLKFEIQEVYSVVAPQVPAAEEAAPAPQAEASAPEDTEASAEAAEQSSSDASNDSAPQSSESSGS
jgi:hypothetical protein